MLRHFLALAVTTTGLAETAPSQPPSSELEVFAKPPKHDAIPAKLWRRIDASVERGLEFLASQQRADGSFPSAVSGQPAVTSLAVMAFLSAGHMPGIGPYGERLEKAIDYVLSCQEADGLLTRDDMPFSPDDSIVYERRPHVATYNHAISGIMMCEAYGSCNAELNERLKPAIESALAWARRLQKRPPRYKVDAGGWRYLHPGGPGRASSDLSVTGWFIMFYRSARNAAFDVRKEHVDEAIEYALSCYDSQTGAFFYGSHGKDYRRVSRSMTGAGLLVTILAGRREQQIARASTDWILNHPFEKYNRWTGGNDRFHYGAYYCSQAMYMVGGDKWAEFYQTLSRTLVYNQHADGGWSPESRYADAQFGRSYTTALAILSLTVSDQLLPIYQR